MQADQVTLVHGLVRHTAGSCKCVHQYHRLNNEQYYWELSIQHLSILSLFLQAEIKDFALCFVMKIQRRQVFLVWCLIVVRHNFLKRHFFLWLVYLFSFECSLNPPFLLGTTAVAHSISLPGLSVKYHLSWSKMVSKRTIMWAWLWIHHIAVLQRRSTIRGNRGPSSELTFLDLKGLSYLKALLRQKGIFGFLAQKNTLSFQRLEIKSIHQGRKPVLFLYNLQNLLTIGTWWPQK